MKEYEKYSELKSQLHNEVNKKQEFAYWCYLQEKYVQTLDSPTSIEFWERNDDRKEKLFELLDKGTRKIFNYLQKESILDTVLLCFDNRQEYYNANSKLIANILNDTLEKDDACIYESSCYRVCDDLEEKVIDIYSNLAKIQKKESVKVDSLVSFIEETKKSSIFPITGALVSQNLYDDGLVDIEKALENIKVFGKLEKDNNIILISSFPKRKVAPLVVFVNSPYTDGGTGLCQYNYGVINSNLIKFIEVV